MPLTPENEPPRRRRGKALDDVLLHAAWEELLEHGYDTFTIERVAERANTSRAVLYRRWPTKPQLVLAALTHSHQERHQAVPDTGTVRGDLIEVMQHANTLRMPLVMAISVQLAGYFVETATAPADLRQSLLGSSVSHLEIILERGVDRGELDPTKLTARRRTLPFDLFRHELLMTHKPVPSTTIEDIIDTVFLPLVRCT